MPEPPVPDDLSELLARPNPAVIATLRPDGWPHSVATWYLWEGGRILVNLDASRARLEFMRKDPRVALTVLDGDAWYRHVSLRGEVVSIEPDEDLADIDRIATHYRGEPYPNRTDPRVSAWIEVTRWHRWQV
jgi:PPOX class probable F420-dependent enzyme